MVTMIDNPAEATMTDNEKEFLEGLSRMSDEQKQDLLDVMINYGGADTDIEVFKYQLSLLYDKYSRK